MTNEYESLSTYTNYSLEAEQSVIGAILLDNFRANDVCEVLNSKDFFMPAHRLLFAAIEFCIENDQPCDAVTLSTYLTESGQLQDAGGLAYLAELAHNTPSASNVKAYTSIVESKRKERDVLCMASQMQEEIKLEDGTSEERINNALSLVTNFDHEDVKELTFKQQNREFLRLFEERSNSGGGITGEATGFGVIDKRLMGLQKSDLLILAARPAQGKTTYAINVAAQVAKKKHTIIFSMEMSAPQISEKLFSMNGVLMTSLKSGKYVDDSESSMMASAGVKVVGLNMTIDDRPALTPQQVRAKCLRLKRKHGELGLIVVDYLQLMRVNKSEGRVNEITQISGALKALAKEMNCPVIALSQLNRSVESRTNKRPVMSDLRDSGSIEQDADIIQFIYRDDYYAEQENRESNNPGVAEIITSKFRGGEVGVDNLRTEFQYSRFSDLPNNYQAPEIKIKGKKKSFEY
jgi:replicative DNA helicase